MNNNSNNNSNCSTNMASGGDTTTISLKRFINFI